MRLILFYLVFALVVSGKVIAQTPSVSICNYLNNKDAAVSITFDDGCKDQFVIGQPILDQFNFDATFFIISSYKPGIGFDYGCSLNLTWSNLQNAINKGHEIASHTMHHTLLDSLYFKYGADTVESEIKKSRDSLNKHLTGQKVLTFAYPEGDGGDNSSESALVRKLLHKYYIGARTAGVNPSGYDTYDDASGGGISDFYYQVESFPNYDTTTLANYATKLDGAIQNGGWFLPMYHTFNQNDYLSVTTAHFSDHMNAINDRKNSLWIAPFRDVLKYHKEKSSASVSLSYSSGAITIVLTDTISNPDFDMPLTLLVSNLASNCQIDSVKQGINMLQYKMAGNSVRFNALPDHGNIIIYKSAVVYSLPVISTVATSSITSTTASSGGNITNDGNSAITAKGVCWSTAAHPTISNYKSADGTGQGNFTSSIVDLNPNTTYYVRAYAVNGVGTAYGNELSFTTANGSPSVTAPILTTDICSSITASGASSGGNITGDGNASIISRGVCWSNSPLPTISDSKTNDGSGIGNFSSSITNLNSNTTYYVRAYAINSAGAGYGNEISFTTSSTTGLSSTLSSNISIYPNPNTGLFNLYIESYDSPLLGLKIISTSGNVIYQEEINIWGNYLKEMDLKGISNGLYFLEIRTEREIVMRKLIVQ